MLFGGEKRIEKAQKTESIRYNTKTRNARESAAHIKSLDNRSNISHNNTEQEQKTKDKNHDKKIFYLHCIIIGYYYVARVHTRKSPRALDKPLRTRNCIGARYGHGRMQ